MNEPHELGTRDPDPGTQTGTLAWGPGPAETRDWGPGTGDPGPGTRDRGTRDRGPGTRDPDPGTWRHLEASGRHPGGPWEACESI